MSTYADHAHDYRHKGFSPLPLPARAKTPPPTGYTGYAGRIASGADIQDWADNGHAGGNIALRLPETVLGLDLDDYDGKPGLTTMLEAVERLGALPPTWTSTSRPGTASGIRFYRVPAGRMWADVLGSGVEVIHYGHRYAVAAPSIHPEGRPYGWTDPEGQASEAPKVDEFPPLPPAWVADLDRGDINDRAGKADLTGDDVRDWLAALPEGEPCRYVTRLLAEASNGTEGNASRHDYMRGYSAKMVRAGDQGHHGVGVGLDSLHSIFLASLKAGKPRAADAGEWARMVSGAVALAAKTPTAKVDRGCCGSESATALKAEAYLTSLEAPNGTQEVRDGATEADDRTEAALDAAAAFARDVTTEAYRLAVREAAQRTVKASREGTVSRPQVVALGEFLAVPDTDAHYRIQGIWPTGGRVVVSAQYKAGKSTLMGNVIRSIADGVPLLDAFETQPGSVVLIDNELDERTLRRWLRDQGIVNTDAVRLVALRGKTATFDILDQQVRADWAKAIGGAEVVIFDCLRPVLDALGLSEDKDAGRFLVAFDALLDQSGVSEGAVVHHMGHSGERSRGDSRILDWPDATWKLLRADTDDPGSVRYFSAFGRDVDQAEAKLSFDPTTRRLTLEGGSRKDSAADELLDPLLDLLAANPEGLSGRQIEMALVGAGYKQASVRTAVKRAAAVGETTQKPGPNRSIVHQISPNNPSALGALPVRQRTSKECVGASYRTHHSLTPDSLSESATHSPPPAPSDESPQVPDWESARALHDDMAQLPGRCQECAQHVGTQGHHERCQQSASVNPEAGK